MIELYKNIKFLREQLKISQDELAKLTGYTSRSSIAKIENGQVDLSQSKIELFAKALQTTPGELVGWCPTTSTKYPSASTRKKIEDLDFFENIVTDDEKDLLMNFRILNKNGRLKASERVAELTEITKYTEPDSK